MSELKTNKIGTNDTNNVAMDNPLKLKTYTTTQRDALSSPEAGDTIYNSDNGNIDFYNGTEWITGDNTFTFTVSYLVVAGGGGGATAWSSANRSGGGGGAGGYRNSYLTETSGRGSSTETPLSASNNQAYNVTVGAGGTGGSGNYFQDGTNGGDSTFNTVTSTGGGGSGDGAGRSDGGCGAGGSYTADASGGQGTAGQGYDGGSRNTGSGTSGGGGGGAGGNGANGTNSFGDKPAGGVGLTSAITGSNVTRAVGGRGFGTGNRENASSNTAGGGSGINGTGPAGNGGSGVVIIRYPNTKTATITAGLTASTSNVGNDKVTTFTAGTGTVTFS